jgi:tetratricopeptide (TPR) repeat protein
MRMKTQQQWLVVFLTVTAAWIQVALGAAWVHAQVQQQLPHRSYYLAFPELYRGDFRSALRRFNSEYRTAFRLGDQRYVDSVCILAMIGECHYRVGDYQTALQRYNDALKLYLTLDAQRWQANIQLPSIIQPDTSAIQRARVTWGASKRNPRIANVPDNISVLRGRLDASRAFEQGGLFDPAELRQVDVTEVLRCAALAISRRREIMGATGRYDPLALRLLGNLKKAGVGNGTLLGAYNGIVYGMALSAVGEYDKAATVLTSSLQFNGGFDHRLTPLGLAELSFIGIAKDKPTLALEFAIESTYAGAYFQQPDVVERGFELATQSHLIANRTPLSALVPAIAWAGRERADMLEASLNIRLAECFSESGDVAASSDALKRAGNLMTNRNNISQTLLVARLRYLTAVNELTAGDTNGGLRSLRAAMKELTAKSPSLFRLQLADSLVVGGGLTEKQSDLLYTVLLQDPSERLWRTEPMDAVAFLLTPHVAAMERWFEILINRKQIDRAVEVADQIRRHRFYAGLPLGGRLLSLRWVLQGDPQFLNAEALQQRQALLMRYSGYRDLLNSATLLRERIANLPLKPIPDSDNESAQRRTMSKLVENYNAQEAAISSIALRREPAEMAFPPIGNASEVQGFVLPGQIVFSVLQTSSGYHVFFFDDQRARYLGLVDAGALKKGVGAMLAKMGVAANFADPQLLISGDWKQAVLNFQDNLFEDIPPEQLQATKELIIIPDGLLWYVPFEAFLVGDDQRPLIENTQVRYCPTLFLAFANPSFKGDVSSTGVVTGAMYRQTEPGIADAAFNDVLEKKVDAKKLNPPLELPADLLADRMDQLVVLSQSSLERGALAMQPMRGDQGLRKSQNQATLLDWMKVPLSSPQHVVMPGLNSIGGAGGLSRPDGSELFFTATSMMAAGGRSLLLSRWNAGGKLQVQLASDYARYAAAMPVTLALKSAINSVRAAEVDLTREPRLKSDPNPPAINGDHPFFWASGLLVSYADQRAVGAVVQAAMDDDVVDDDVVDDAAGSVVGNAADKSLAKEDDVHPEPAGTPPAASSSRNSRGAVGDLADDGVTAKAGDKEGSNSKILAGDPGDAPNDDDDDDDEGAVWKIGGKK